MARRIGLFVTIMLLCAVCGHISRSCARSEGNSWHSYRTFAFNTDCRLELSVPNARSADAAAAKCLSLLTQINDSLNRFDENSAVSQFNRLPAGQTFDCDEVLWRAFICAQSGYDITNGKFDITIGPLMQYWKAVAAGQSPAENGLAAARARVGFEKLTIDAENHTVTKAVDGMEVDFGGMAKGLALDLTRELLMAEGITSCLLNFGGNLYINIGSAQRDAIAISDPRQENATLLTLINCNGRFIATSSNAFRALVPGKVSHIIDPNDGKPAQTLLSATAIAASGCLSDMLSTAVFIGGETLARQISSDVPQTGFVLLTADGQTIVCGDAMTE